MPETTTITPTTDTIADDPNTPQKVRAWAFHCQGLHSPEISQRLGTPERTVRHWIATITSDLAADHQDQCASRLTLAIARKRHLSAAAWDGYERALAIEASQHTRTLAAPEANDANDDSATRAADQTARHALGVAARFLRLVITIDRDLAALEAAFDEDCAARERQQLEDERDQQEQAWEQQCEEQREQQHAKLARERMLREQDRLDRAREREREPQPPSDVTAERLHLLEVNLTPEERSPRVNAYFAARDTYHAARRAAARYASILDGTATDSDTDIDVSDQQTSGATAQWDEGDTERRTFSTLPTLSPADIAALTARLDAEEAASDAITD